MARTHDMILNEHARRALELSNPLYVPPVHQEHMGTWAGLMQDVYQEGCEFPPNLAFDMIVSASMTYGSPGDKFCAIPGWEKWDTWLEEHWIPYVEQRAPGDVKYVMGKLAMPPGPTSRLPRTRDDKGWQRRLKLLDENPGSCWSCSTGKAIWDVVNRSAPLRELVPQSALIEAVSRRPRCDSLYGASLIGTPCDVEDRTDVGTSAGGDRSEVVESSSGNFLSRHPGPLPDNIGRLSPIELLYCKRVKRLFLIRAAESSLDQRYFEMSMHSNRVVSIRVHLALIEDPGMHQSPEHGRPSLPRYRSMFLDLLKALINVGLDVNIDMEIVTSHETLFGDDRVDIILDQETQEAWSGHDPHRLAIELARDMPNLLNQWPVPNKGARPMGVTTRPRKSDKEIDIVLSSRGATVQLSPNSSDIYRAHTTHDGMWRIRDIHPMQPAEIVEWILDQVFSQGRGTNQHTQQRKLQDVEFN